MKGKYENSLLGLHSFQWIFIKSNLYGNENILFLSILFIFISLKQVQCQNNKSFSGKDTQDLKQLLPI